MRGLFHALSGEPRFKLLLVLSTCWLDGMPGGGLNLNFDIACRFGHTALRCSKHCRKRFPPVKRFFCICATRG
nr:MAG TPA: hypothetical protein [Caudoviricetes sp.]